MLSFNHYITFNHQVSKKQDCLQKYCLLNLQILPMKIQTWVCPFPLFMRFLMLESSMPKPVGLAAIFHATLAITQSLISS